MSKYYTLAVRENGKWSPQFGSYDRADVKDERATYRCNTADGDLTIVTSAPDQASINAAIAALNA